MYNYNITVKFEIDIEGDLDLTEEEAGARVSEMLKEDLYELDLKNMEIKTVKTKL